MSNHSHLRDQINHYQDCITELRGTIRGLEVRINNLKCERDEYSESAIRTELTEEKVSQLRDQLSEAQGTSAYYKDLAREQRFQIDAHLKSEQALMAENECLRDRLERIQQAWQSGTYEEVGRLLA